MTTAQKLVLQLLRYELNNIEVDSELIAQMDDNMLNEVFACSSEHDVGYIVGSALHKLGLLSGDIQTTFFTEQLASVYRYERIKYETDCITSLFEQEKLAFVLLKGAVVRALYPKPEMRMSCDVDILLHSEDVERAGELLKDKLSFAYDSQSGHEVNWLSPSGLKVELHFTLLERDYEQKDVLDNVWSYANPVSDGAYQHVLTDEFFAFYHISHISKHFLNGGCGIRQFMDLWFIQSKLELDEEKLRYLLDKAGLKKFASVAYAVADSWFSSKKSSTLPVGIEDYILGGAFGTTESTIALEKEKNNLSKVSIFLKRVFPSKKTLNHLYPQSKSYPVLLPYFALARWYRILLKDRMKRQSKMIKAIVSSSEESQTKIAELLKEIGLGEQYNE